MKPYDWNQLKNQKLKAERLISFEDILTAIDEGKVLANIKHHNDAKYRNQKVLVVNVDDYAYLVPYIEDEEKIFLKTTIPSRRATRKYLKGEK